MNNFSTHTILLIAIFILLTLLIYLMFNQKINISRYTISNPIIPKEFNNYKIVLLSDLHYKQFGQNNYSLINTIRLQKPDLIVLAGDMIDKTKTNFSNTESLFKGISSIAPIYCVSGNHEIANSEIESSMDALYKKYNITKLNNTSVKIYINSSYIILYGIDYTGPDHSSKLPALLEERLMPASKDIFSILLNHRSDIFNEISIYNYHLVLTGHSHGGIIRIPFIGGLIANDKSLFPKYDAGCFTKNKCTMITSRGLGNSNSIPRIFNRPDISVITLSR